MSSEEEIRALLEGKLDIRTTEKEELGEVFTPLSMIDNLYDHFPSSVMNDPKKKWLDPATGIGNFPIVLYFRLMKSLARAIPSAQRRSKHIIENMIYMVEINKGNASKCARFFARINPDVAPNIASADFLLHSDADGFHHKGWPTHYDCVIGNPPYNIGGTKHEGTKRVHVTFAERSLQMMNRGGLLAYICPPNYREANSRMNEIFREAGGHLVYIKIYGAEETNKLFHVQARVDGFIYQRDIAGKTVIDDEYDVHVPAMQLDLAVHIPNFGHTIFAKLLAKVRQLGAVEAYRNTELSSTKVGGTCGRHKILHLIVAKGRRVFKSGKKHSLIGVPKIFVNGLGVPYVFYDSEGKYGASQSPNIVERPSSKLVAFMESDFFAFVAWGLRLTGNNNMPYLFNYVPAIPANGPTLRNVHEIGLWLGLTTKETKFISDNFSAYNFIDKDINEPCGRGTRKIGLFD